VRLIGYPIFILLILLCPLFADAQQNQRLRDRDPDLAAAKAVTGELQQARLHYGPFYLLSRLRVSDIGFSSSIYVPSSDAGDTLSFAVEAPQRLYFVPHKKAIFTAEVTPSYNFFTRSSDNGQLDYSARGDAHLMFNHLYVNGYVLLSDQLRAHVSDVNRLATVETGEVGVAGELKYSSKTSMVFKASRSNLEYPDERYQPDGVPMNLLDRNDTRTRLALHHKTFPLTSLFVAGEISDHDFERASYKDSRRTWYSGGATYDTGRTQLRVEAGPLKLDFESPDEEDYSGIGVNIGASRSNGRWLYSARAERDVGFSILLDNNFYVSTAVSGKIDYDATRRLMLHTGSAWQRDDFARTYLGQDREDTISFTWVGFTYNMRRLQAGVDAGWYERKSTIGIDEDSGIRWVLRLSYTL
jgi:hypothetical protein